MSLQAVTLASRGEPLVYPDISRMLAYASGKFLALKLNTNASLLDEAKCHVDQVAFVNYNPWENACEAPHSPCSRCTVI